MAAEHCWQCRKKFVKHPRTGEPIFALVGDGLRVHKGCKESAELVLRPNRPCEPIQGRTPPAPMQQ